MSLDDALKNIFSPDPTQPGATSSLQGGGVNSSPTPVLVRMCDVKPEAVSWLWPGRIALGKLTLVAGDPGLGKSFLTLDITARLSSGTPWPDRRDEPNPVGGVVLLSAEDDVADTIRPRLDAAGADVARITAIQGVEFSEAGTGKRVRRSFNLEKDIPALEAAIQQTPDCRLVVVDPVTAYLGKTDSHRNADIRGLLAPLSELAGRYRVAMVAVTHLNKGGGSNALYRAMGSLAFVAAARAVWLVVRDEENPSRRLFLSAKNNIAPEGTGLAYSLEPRVGDPGMAVVAWEAVPVTVTANEALTVDQSRHDKPTERDTATDWLRELLASGPLPATEVKGEANSAGFAWATLRRAKERLGIRPRKSGFDAGWIWELPKGIAPEDTHEGAKMLTPLDVSTFGQGEHLGRTDVVNGVTDVPAGWSESSWAAELERKAACCESTNPALAAEHRRNAAATRAAGMNPKKRMEPA
jgi:hypothetical protein